MTAQVLPQIGTTDIARILLQIKRFITRRQLARNLLETPLQSEQDIRLAHDPRIDLKRITNSLRSNQRQLTEFIGPKAAEAFFSSKLTGDRGVEAHNLLSELCSALNDFSEAVNLNFIYMAETYVIHCNFDLQVKKH